MRAEALRRIGDLVAAGEAYRRAMGMTEDGATREFLFRKLASLGDERDHG